MGIAAEQNRFAHALRKEIVLALGDDAHDLGQILARPRGCRTTINVGTSHERRHSTQGNPHESGLAAPIGPQDRVEFPRPNGQRDSYECVPIRAGIAVANVGQLE